MRRLSRWGRLAMPLRLSWRFDMFAFCFIRCREGTLSMEWPILHGSRCLIGSIHWDFSGSILSTFLIFLISSFFFSPLLFAVSALVRLKAMFSKVWIFHECLGTSCHDHVGCLKKPLNWASNTRSFVALIRFEGLRPDRSLKWHPVG